MPLASDAMTKDKNDPALVRYRAAALEGFLQAALQLDRRLGSRSLTVSPPRTQLSLLCSTMSLSPCSLLLTTSYPSLPSQSSFSRLCAPLYSLTLTHSLTCAPSPRLPFSTLIAITIGAAS